MGVDRLRRQFGELFHKAPYTIINTGNGYEFSAPPLEGPKGPYDGVYQTKTSEWVMGEAAPCQLWDLRHTPAGEILENSRVYETRVFVNGADSVDVLQVVDRNLTPQVAGHLEEITRLANSPENSYNNPQDRMAYQTAAMGVLEAGTDAMLKFYDQKAKDMGVMNPFSSGNYAVFPPLHGGEFTAAALAFNLNKKGIHLDIDRVACAELKRVHMPDGKMYVGYRKGYSPPVDDMTAIIFADDCISTHISADVSMSIAKQSVGKNLEFPPVALVVAASQIGMIELNESHGAHVITGGLVPCIDPDGYLRRASEDGKLGPYYVGDMGKWLGRLPEGYDEVAPWNKVRRDIVDYWQNGSNRWPKHSPQQKTS